MQSKYKKKMFMSKSQADIHAIDVHCRVFITILLDITDSQCQLDIT